MIQKQILRNTLPSKFEINQKSRFHFNDGAPQLLEWPFSKLETPPSAQGNEMIPLRPRGVSSHLEHWQSIKEKRRDEDKKKVYKHTQSKLERKGNAKQILS